MPLFLQEKLRQNMSAYGLYRRAFVSSIRPGSGSSAGPWRGFIPIPCSSRPLTHRCICVRLNKLVFCGDDSEDEMYLPVMVVEMMSEL